MSIVYFTGIYVLSYVILTTVFLGWQSSMSNTYKSLLDGYKWIFVVFMFGLAALCFAIGKNNATTLMGFGCIVVGSFPRFYDDQNLQHYAGALMIIAFGMWQVGYIDGLWYLPIIFFLIAIPIYYFKVRNYILWIELCAIVIILGGFIIDKSLK